MHWPNSHIARAAAITICWAIVLVGSTWAQPAGKNISVAFIETCDKAVKSPGKSVSLWQKFAEQNKADDLGQLAKLLAGIELLRRSDNVTDMSKVLAYFQFRLPAKPASPDAPRPSYLRKQIALAGKGLSARVQMLQLGQKLQKYYRKHIEYPQTLNELVSEGSADAADLIDPFGEPFAYQSKARKLMPDLPRQTFSLRCLSIDAERRGLGKCLKRAAKPITDIELGNLLPQSNRAYVKRRRPDGAFGESKRWAVGGNSGKLVLWAVYDSYVIAAWKQFPIVIVKQ